MWVYRVQQDLFRLLQQLPPIARVGRDHGCRLSAPKAVAEEVGL